MAQKHGSLILIANIILYIYFEVKVGLHFCSKHVMDKGAYYSLKFRDKPKASEHVLFIRVLYSLIRKANFSHSWASRARFLYLKTFRG